MLSSIRRSWLLLSVVAASLVPLQDASACRHRHRCCATVFVPASPCEPIAVPCPESLGSVRRAAPTAPTERELFVSPRGTRYEFIETDDPGTEEQLRRELDESERRIAAFSRAVPRNTQDFLGHDRKAAKTSIADAQIEPFHDLGGLLDSLTADGDMPEIGEDEDSDRIDLEERNVTVHAWLVAAKHEADNDYHLILGNHRSPSGRRYMTAEVSGLPHGRFRQPLSAPRHEFQDFFSSHPIGDRYRVFPQPIPVRVSGSLFFDVDHPVGAVGPQQFKPRTAWEIHPVTDIEFEPR